MTGTGTAPMPLTTLQSSAIGSNFALHYPAFLKGVLCLAYLGNHHYRHRDKIRLSAPGRTRLYHTGHGYSNSYLPEMGLLLLQRENKLVYEKRTTPLRYDAVCMYNVNKIAV